MALNLIRPDKLAPLLPVEAVAPAAPVSDPAQKLPDFSAGQRFPASTGASLSATGRFLGALAQDAARLTAAPPLTSTEPLLSAPPADSRQLPALLREALSRSGLFYESHQAQWVAGRRTLGQLLQEPQGGLSTGASSQIIRVIEKPPRNVNSEPEAAAAGAVRNADSPVHAQTLTLVQQQLSVLETGQLSWRGEIWPGQWMEWDIAEHRSAASEIDAPSRWQTRLHVTLPKLGEVTAILGIDSHGVHIVLGAAAAETAALLQGSQQPLAAAMAVAGLSAVAVEVRNEPGK